jgi:hypothetical protein
MKRLMGIERDDWSGMETHYYVDDVTHAVTIQRLQDVEDTLNANVAEYNSHGDHKASNFKGPMHKMASVPFAVAEKWMREDGLNIFTASDEETDRVLRRRLNDSSYRKLRTKPGRL